MPTNKTLLTFSFAALAAACSPPANTTDASDSSVDIQNPVDVVPNDVRPDAPPPPANVECSGATVLAPGTPIVHEDTTPATHALTSACDPTALGQALFYKINVPAGMSALVTATPDPHLDIVLRFMPACGAACSNYMDVEGVGVPEIGHWSNRGTAAADVIIGASSFTRSEGTFDLVASLVPSEEGVTCETAPLLTSGTTLHGENMYLAEFAGDTRCVTTPAGFELFYRVSVPASQRLTITATPTTMWNALIRVFDSCAATTCVAMGDSAAAGAAETLTWTNTGTAATEVIFSVGSVTTRGSFDLAVNVAP